MNTNPVFQLLFETGMTAEDAAARTGLPQDAILRSLSDHGCLNLDEWQALQSLWALSPIDRRRNWSSPVEQAAGSHRPVGTVSSFSIAIAKANDRIQSGRFVEAQDAVREVFEVATNTHELATAYNAAGGVHRGMARFEAARINLEAATKLLPPTDPMAFAIYNNLGAIHLRLGLPQVADHYTSKVKHHASASDTRKGWACLTSGDCQLFLGDLRQASISFHQSYKHFEAGHQKRIEAMAARRDDSPELYEALVRQNFLLGLEGDEGAIAKLSEWGSAMEPDCPESTFLAKIFVALLSDDFDNLEDIARQAMAIDLREMAWMAQQGWAAVMPNRHRR